MLLSWLALAHQHQGFQWERHLQVQVSTFMSPLLLKQYHMNRLLVHKLAANGQHGNPAPAVLTAAPPAGRLYKDPSKPWKESSAIMALDEVVQALQKPVGHAARWEGVCGKFCKKTYCLYYVTGGMQTWEQ